eukprot:3858240-Prymnesium_polylepis.1
MRASRAGRLAEGQRCAILVRLSFQKSRFVILQGTDEWRPLPPGVPKTDQGAARARTRIISQNHRPSRYFRVYKPCRNGRRFVKGPFGRALAAPWSA